MASSLLPRGQALEPFSLLCKTAGSEIARLFEKSVLRRHAPVRTALVFEELKVSLMECMP